MKWLNAFVSFTLVFSRFDFHHILISLHRMHWKHFFVLHICRVISSAFSVDQPVIARGFSHCCLDSCLPIRGLPQCCLCRAHWLFHLSEIFTGITTVCYLRPRSDTWHVHISSESHRFLYGTVPSAASCFSLGSSGLVSLTFLSLPTFPLELLGGAWKRPVERCYIWNAEPIDCQCMLFSANIEEWSACS